MTKTAFGCNLQYPANILFGNAKALFESLLEKYDIEQAFKKGLSSELVVVLTNRKLDDFAKVKFGFNNDNDEKYTIEVYDNYCQYLWSLIYSHIHFFNVMVLNDDEKSENDKIKACVNFELAVNLFIDKSTHRDSFFYQSNPINNPHDEGVQIANYIYINSLAFVLLHEFAHIDLGHMIKNKDVSHEYESDFQAFYNLIQGHQKNKMLVSFGCITAITSILFIDDTLLGGENHPDPDLRLKKILENIEDYLLDIECSYSYIYAVIWLKVWAVHYGKFELIKRADSQQCKTAKDYFLAILQEFDHYKKQLIKS